MRDEIGIPKVRTGIVGFDDITNGGLPAGRASLVCGGPGCGKSLFATEFLARGARDFGEPGAFFSFEESIEQIKTNVRSLGFDLDALIDRDLLAMDHIVVDPATFELSGDFDLEGLFVRIGFAIDSVGAKRVVLDTLESLFIAFEEKFLRAELARLFRFLASRGVSTVVTGEQGDGQLTRYGLEEYVSDCVVFLDHRVDDLISTRRVRVVKYRGSSHGTREFPFIIDEEGLQVLPVTTLKFDAPVSNERVSTGIDGLDAMLGGGVFRGSSVLLSGTPGTGKTTLGATMASAACARGEKAILFSFEESPAQLIRNLGSVGLDLQKHVDAGLLMIQSTRPQYAGLEGHLLTMQREVGRFDPAVIIVDPITALMGAGQLRDVTTMLLRFIDFAKLNQITAVFVNLDKDPGLDESSELHISSMMDTWVLLRSVEHGRERNRTLYVLKSRGTAHSNQLHEFRMTENGIEILGPQSRADGSDHGGSRRGRTFEPGADTSTSEGAL